MPGLPRSPRARATSCPRTGSRSRASSGWRPTAQRYGYQPIETPLFEQAAVFERGVGEVTDVVEKELFLLAPRDRGRRERWALRPSRPPASSAPTSSTACRRGRSRSSSRRPARCSATTGRRPAATASSGSSTSRHRRSGPGGRRRDHRAGRASTREAGLDRRRGPAQLDRRRPPAGRPTSAELAATTASTSTELPPLERSRLERNPLRLLDSKDRDGGAQRSRAADHRPPVRRVREHFAARARPPRRARRGVPLEPGARPRPRLLHAHRVRVLPAGREGQQSALGGGGRYDGLVELLGGRPTPGIGFGLGLDRRRPRARPRAAIA